MSFKDLMEINPTFFVALVGALGLKDILWEWIKRRWTKDDEKEQDHKDIEELKAEIQELKATVSEILEIQKVMQENDRRSDENDLMMIGRQILDLQNRAIAKEKVSNACMPDYLEAYEHYNELANRTGFKVSERIKINHEIILEMVKNGQVVETLKEWYK